MTSIMDKTNLMSLSVEIYQAILWYLDVTDRTRMLCVCKQLFRPSLPVAWYEVYGLDALFLLLPVEISETFENASSQVAHTSLLEDSRIRIKHVRIITSQRNRTPSRLQEYAPNIRVLRVCNPKSFRYNLVDVETLDRVLLTPNLEKLIISPSRTPLDQAIDLVAFQALRLCTTDNVKSVGLFHTPTAIQFGPNALRFEIETTLAYFRSLPQIEDLYLSLDFYRASYAETTSPLNLFQGFNQLTSLSALAGLVIPNVNGLNQLAQLPNLARLHLMDWYEQFLPRTYPSRPPTSEIWFPNLREIHFEDIEPGRAYILLSSTLPAQLRCIELVLDDEYQDINHVIQSISQHRETLEQLKLESRKNPVKMLQYDMIPELFELDSLRILEVTRYQVENLAQTAFMTAWPVVTKLHWLDQTIDPESLMTLSQQRPMIQELAFTIGHWSIHELPPPGFPLPAPENRQVSLSEAREHWYLLSERSVRFTSRFIMRRFSDETVKAVARFFVWCWRGVNMYREVPSDERAYPYRWHVDAVRYSELLAEVSAARARLYVKLD